MIVLERLLRTVSSMPLGHRVVDARPPEPDWRALFVQYLRLLDHRDQIALRVGAASLWPVAQAERRFGLPRSLATAICTDGVRHCGGGLRMAPSKLVLVVRIVGRRPVTRTKPRRFVARLVRRAPDTGGQAGGSAGRSACHSDWSSRDDDGSSRRPMGQAGVHFPFV